MATLDSVSLCLAIAAEQRARNKINPTESDPHSIHNLLFNFFLAFWRAEGGGGQGGREGGSLVLTRGGAGRGGRGRRGGTLEAGEYFKDFFSLFDEAKKRREVLCPGYMMSIQGCCGLGFIAAYKIRRDTDIYININIYYTTLDPGPMSRSTNIR